MSPQFTPAGYASILGAAIVAGYRPLGMRDAIAARPGRVVLLRHDVDFSLDYALEMAALEKELGLCSTYFLLLYNDYYNPLSPSGRRQVRQLAAMGHEIGLHWDSSIYPQQGCAMRDYFRRELEALGAIVDHAIVSASQHIPADSPALDVSGLVEHEAYSASVRDRFSYVSDSAMTWRELTPFDLIERSLEFQFLAHPLWWFASGETREQKLRNIPSDCRRFVSGQCESFIGYMNGVLADRARYDQRFRRLHGLEE